MDKVIRMFNIARNVAIEKKKKDMRDVMHGAVGQRRDGTLVFSKNSPVREKLNNAHAENKLCKKLDWNSTVYVVRVDVMGVLKLSKPCINCETLMRIRGVKKCYYSISEYEYGCITF